MTESTSPRSPVRAPLFAANWKMHHLRSDAAAYATHLRDHLPQVAGESAWQAWIFPAATTLAELAAQVEPLSDRVWVGAQDLHPEAAGAHTGDLSGPMLRDAGARAVLCGHSERRRDHWESNEWVGRKVAAALEHGLTPVLCVGETLEEREADRTMAVLEEQLTAGLVGLDGVGTSGQDTSGLDTANPETDESGLVIAYEPVWAIGTGRTADPETAESVHAEIREWLTQRFDETTSQGLRILYGGSVKPANARDLFAGANVDGFLIGGAGLDPGQFLDIIRLCDAR